MDWDLFYSNLDQGSSPLVPIKYITNIVAGSTPDSNNENYWSDNGISWVSISDMSKTDSVYSTTRQVSAEGLSVARLQILPPETVLFAIYASVGEVAITKIPATWNQAILGFEVDKSKIIPKYLYYCLKHMKHILPIFYKSNTQHNLSAEQVGNFKIPLPSLPEQYKLVSKLDRELAEIDGLIADQQRLQGLLQERLVSLTFDLATDASNPDRYETGHPFWKTLPKGWTLQKIGWHFRVGNGSTPLSNNKNYWSEDNSQIPWFNSSTVNQYLATVPARYVTEMAVKECHLPLVPKGSLLMGMIGQGKTRGKVTKTGIDATLSQNIAYLTPIKNSNVDIDFARLVLEAAYPELREINSGNGTTKGSLTCEHIQQFKIPIPSKAHQSEIINLHKETYNEIQFLINKTDQSELLFNSKKFSIINSLLTINN